MTAAAGPPARTREVRVVAVPFEGALHRVGMGEGPVALLQDDGFRQVLRAGGRRVRLAEVGASDPQAPEVALAFEQHRRVATLVGEAVAAGAFPVVLAGGCASSIGTVAGLGPADLGVVWLDAHADYDTPQDNVSGFLDVMALSTVTGRCWQALARTVPGHRPVAEERVVLAAVRDLAPYQREAAEASAMTLLPGAFDVAELDAALGVLPAPRLLLHLDLDALDAGEAPANRFAAPGGPSLVMLLEAIDAVFARREVAGLALTAYEPGADPQRRALAAARTLVERALTHVG